MRISEIIPYIDLDRMAARTFVELYARLKRELPKEAHDRASARYRQYGNKLHDLSVEQAQLNTAKTRAEITHLLAQAAKARCETVISNVDALQSTTCIAGEKHPGPRPKHTQKIGSPHF